MDWDNLGKEGEAEIKLLKNTWAHGWKPTSSNTVFLCLQLRTNLNCGSGKYLNIFKLQVSYM